MSPTPEVVTLLATVEMCYSSISLVVLFFLFVCVSPFPCCVLCFCLVLSVFMQLLVGAQGGSLVEIIPLCILDYG